MKNANYYPYERLAIRLDTTHLLIKGLYWLSSYWGTFQRFDGKWIKYSPEEDSIEEVISDKYAHVPMENLKAISTAFDEWKLLAPTLDEPLDFSYCDEFVRRYDFENTEPVAEGYPPLSEFYEIYRWSRNFVDGYFDGLDHSLFGGSWLGASERDMYYNEILEIQARRTDYENEIKARRHLTPEAIEALQLVYTESHPVLLDCVKRLHDLAFFQYQLECQRLRIDDDWSLFFPTSKYHDFLLGKVRMTTKELLEVMDYFTKQVLHGSRFKSGLVPIIDPLSTSSWYQSVMGSNNSRKTLIEKVEVKMCQCMGMKMHDDFGKSTYQFPNGTIETLHEICPENELLAEELYLLYIPILKTRESDENWTMFACYSGQIAEVRPGLYFYSFGDTEEVGERNFYIQGELESVMHMLLDEWGPSAPPWRKFLNQIGINGYPKSYEPGGMVSAADFFPTVDEPTLTVSVSFNMENTDLLRILRSLT